MPDDTLVEPFSVPEIFVDGFTEHTLHNGVMSCVGFRLQVPPRASGDILKVVVVRLIWPAQATDEAIADARHAQATPVRIAKVDRLRRH